MLPSDIRLWVILPVYGNWQDTHACLSALDAQSAGGFRVLIADDGSPTPPPPSILCWDFAEYVRGEHRGFAANCNAAAGQAIERGATHLLFLNNDTVFAPAFMAAWLRTIAGMPDAILSPLIYRFDKKSRIWFSGGNMTVWAPFFRQRRSFQNITPVDIVTGCALLVPVGPWLDLGGFDKTYVTYYEDFDFTIRAKRRGVRTYVVPDPDLRVWHKESGSFRASGRWAREYRLLASSLIFIRTHYRGPSRWLCLGLKCAHLVAIAFWCLPEWPRPRALWRAVAEGLSAQT